MDEHGYLRIGELSRRTGVSPELLRAWESRYRLLQPTRSAGGFRLYSAADERRVHLATRFIAEGMAAAEAASRAIGEAERTVATPRVIPGPATLLDDLRVDLTEALRAFDAARANDVLDRALASFTVEVVLRDLLLVYLRDLGDRWKRGEATIAEEHMASNLLRGRLLGLARGWSDGTGPSIVVACPPGELHDLGAIVFGIVASGRGWRITFLGADSPFQTIADAVRALRPDLVVLTVTDPARSQLDASAIRELSSRTRIAIGGVDATAAARLGVERLPGDPVSAALGLGDAAT